MPELIIIVDTEEEFDWNAPFQRKKHDVSHISELMRVQNIFDAFGVRPVYACTYPILSTPSSREIIETLVREHNVLVGAHLHPWVTPPFDEHLSEENSFPGNLPYKVEAAKLKRLTHIVQETLQKHPKIYFAGRYGLGKNTYTILQEQEYEIDVSMAPPQNYAPLKGPDYSHSPNYPFWVTKEDSAMASHLYCIPTTGSVLGLLSSRKYAHTLNRFIRRPICQSLHLPGLLSHLGLLDALRLTPEGNSLSDMKRLTQHLLKRGHTTFAMNFHSPSLAVGHTPYVQSKKECDALLQKVRDYLAYFRDDVGGVFTDPFTQRADALSSQDRTILTPETLFKPWKHP